MKKDLLLNLFVTFSVGILAFVVNRVFAQNLGKEALGLMSLMSQLIAYLNLVDMGIATTATYALYKPFADRDYQKINTIYSTVDNYFKKVSLFVVIFGTLIAVFLPYITHSNSFGSEIYIYWGLYILNTAWAYLNTKYIVLLTANQEYGYTLKISGIARVLIKILQLFALIYFKSFVLFILLFNLQNIFNYIFLSRKIKQEYKWLKKVKDRYKQIKVDMKNMFWHKSAELIVFNTDYIVISIFTSLKVVAVYSTYMLVYNMILTVVNILLPVLTPHIGSFIAKNNINNIYKLWLRLHSLYVYLAVVVALVTFYTINSFVYLWMGKDYLLDNVTVLLIVINLYLTIGRSMIETFKNNTGVYNDIYNPILESLINLIFSLILVKFYGLNGVIIGTIISNIVIIYISKPLVVFKKSFQKSIKDYILVYLKYTILTIIAIFAVEYFLNYNINITNWYSFIVYLFKVTIVSSLLSFVIFYTDKSYREVIVMIYKKATK